MENSLLPNVSKIAVLRATALGDFVFSLPALLALHEAYPQAEIVYLGRQWHAGLLPGRLPGVRRVIAVPPPEREDIDLGFVVHPALEDAFFRQLQPENFDLAVQLHGGGGRSNPFLLKLNARTSIGLRVPGAAALDRWIPYTYYQHEVFRLLEVVALAGARLPSNRLDPHLPVLPTDLAAASPALADVQRPFVVIHPGANDPRRTWPAHKFARLADDCIERLGLPVVLTGTERETRQVTAVQESMRREAVNLCGKLELPALVGVLSQASLVIGNDTGPLHLALAAGARAVGLFWVKNVVTSLPLNRERFLPLISWQQHCPLCGEDVDQLDIDRKTNTRCSHQASFLETIPVEDVIGAVERLLGSMETPV